MISAELNKMLIESLPCLLEKYLDEVNWQEGDDTGSHTVYGDVLTPYLIDCIENDNEQEYTAIFHYLEKLLELNDEYAEEVVYLSVFESISYIFKERSYLKLHLGEKCKKAIERVS